MLRSIDHFIGGSTFASGERQGEVFDPNQGQVQAQVRLGTSTDLQKAIDAGSAQWKSSRMKMSGAVLASCSSKARTARWLRYRSC